MWKTNSTACFRLARMSLALRLALLLALLYSPACHGELRARDPDLEEEEPLDEERAMTDLPLTWTHHSLLKHPGVSEHSGRESLRPPAQRGNWCAYVKQRMVTSAVLCATETNTVKSVKPCPDGDPNCKITTHRQSSRPMYKQKQMLLSSLLWKCCPGYGGHNCLGKDDPLGHEKQASKSEVSDDGNSGGAAFLGDATETDIMKDEHWIERSPEEADNQDSSSNQSPLGPLEGITTSQPLPFLDSSILLAMHQLMSTMMSQIQPVLDRFNQTLENLSGKVETLSQDLQELKNKQENDRTTSREEGHNGPFKEKLKDSRLHISHMQTQLEEHKKMERAFQSQQELMMHNLTKTKEKLDDHIRQNQETEVNLRFLGVKVEEVKLSQQKLENTIQRERTKFVSQRESHPAGVWEAITRIEDKAQSNFLHLRNLSETSNGSTRLLQDMQKDLLNLEKSLEEIKQRNEVYYVETGLEVEATRVRVLNSVDDLTANLSAHEGQLREIDLDLESIFILIQRNESEFGEQACSCKPVTRNLLALEHEVANLTQLVRQNSFELEEANLERNQAELEDLHQGLVNMKESLAFEQGRSRSLQDTIYQLRSTLLDSQQEIQVQRERHEDVTAEIRGLSATFSSLLNDAVRHSEVLEVLLGEEVLEFTRWSDSQKIELSLPDLLHQVQLIQRKIEAHDRSLTSLWRMQPVRNEMNSDDPVAWPEETGSKNQEMNTERDPDSPTAEEDVDYSVSDFWSLGKEVEQLASRVTILEERCDNCTKPPDGHIVQLQREIASFSQTLDDHMRMFQNVFTNTQELANSSRSLNLDEVWRLLRKKEGKRGRGQQKQEGNSSGRRKRLDVSLVDLLRK